MQRATGTQPARRQLNSEAIRGAALCYISPIVVGILSVISAKCTWNVREKNLDMAWSAICRKRNTCDKAIKGNIPYHYFGFA